MAKTAVFLSDDELGVRTEILDRFPTANITFDTDPLGTIFVDVHDVDDSSFYKIRHDILTAICNYSALMGLNIGDMAVVRKAKD